MNFNELEHTQGRAPSPLSADWANGLEIRTVDITVDPWARRLQ